MSYASGAANQNSLTQWIQRQNHKYTISMAKMG